MKTTNLQKRTILGIGGGGCKILQDIANFDDSHTMVYINNDKSVLERIESDNKFLVAMGSEEIVQYEGGLNEFIEEKVRPIMQEEPEQNKNSNDHLSDKAFQKKLAELIQDEKQIFIVSTLGGNMGSVATPKIVEYLTSLDKDVVVFVTIPFKFEGKQRMALVNNALKELEAISKNVVVIDNEELLASNKGKPVPEIFAQISKEIYEKMAYRG